VTAGPVPPVAAFGQPRITAGFNWHHRLDLQAHNTVHPPLAMLDLGQLIQLADAIVLRGRGGAGFPFARKLVAVADSAQERALSPVVVVNGTEGEPAAWKDKVLLTRAPHLILDGAELAAETLAAAEIVVAVADDGVGEASMTAALAERVLPVPARLVRVPHRFISGEGGALVRGINGETPIPPGIKVRASDTGVGGRPTLLSNAETFAQLGLAARIGPYEYNSTGLRDEPGTVLLTITGSAPTPIVVECPTGTPLEEVLWQCSAPIGPAILIGGFHGMWMTAEQARGAVISRDLLARRGVSLGAGVIAPLGEGTCPLGEAARVVDYLAKESAGQCGPCRLGLPDLARRMSELVTGTGSVAAVRAAANGVRGRGACYHPDGTAGFAISAADAFAADVAAHSRGGSCGRPVRGVLPIPGALSDGSAKLAVDWTRCEGHGLCAHVAPDLISLDGNGFPAFADAPVPVRLEAAARRAVSMCPGLALRLSEPQGAATSS
jgi:NADH:ubiquinone oxidoreductase subunit F (NADH-binding)/ferredoxin